MARFCSNCGTQLSDDAKFCNNCGTSVNQAQTAPRPAPQPETQYAQGVGYTPGFSNRVNDPEIVAAVKKNRKASAVFMLFIVPLPLIGFLIYGSMSKDMEIGQAFLFGAIVSAIFLVFALVGLAKNRAEKSYDAVVVDKKSRTAYGHRDSSDGSREMIYEYITVVRTDDGRTKNIVEREGSMIIAYNYLNVGDRFRYHPQFNFQYELYDKSKAPYIGCVSCGAHNPTGADRCQRCNTPLLK